MTNVYTYLTMQRKPTKPDPFTARNNEDRRVFGKLTVNIFLMGVRLTRSDSCRKQINLGSLSSVIRAGG